MPDIARLDAAGVLSAIEAVDEADHKDDPAARTVALPAVHDMHARIGDYRWDWLRHAFLPVSAEPREVAERETPGLVEGLVEFVEAMEKTGVVLPAKTRKALRAFRATVDGRRRPR
jgi:hypothetical protein